MTASFDRQDQSDSAPDREGRSADLRGEHAPRNLARWYWGTAGLLVAVAVIMSTIAGKQYGDDSSGAPETPVAEEATEDSATWAENQMKKAERRAMSVMDDIDAMLDAAYEPVYAGVPGYMDFHYSLEGEWLELSAGVLGQMESRLDQQLFAGLDSRIENISAGLQSTFDRLWLASIEESLAASQGANGPISELASRSVGDARDRIKTTAKVFGGLSATGGALLILPRIIASKLGRRIASKVAAKTGAKWVATASGAGSAAALCAWAGPGAAGCAVAGAVISWVGVDYAMIKLDEHVSRDEFEQDLHALVDEQKAEVRRFLEDTVGAKLLRTQSERKITVRNISLSELPDYDRRVACQAAGEISGSYLALVDNLKDRSPEKVASLSELLASQEDNRLLAPWVEGIGQDLSVADLNVRLTGAMKIKVQVPPELQNGREMRAVLQLGDLDIRSEWIEPNSYGNFVFRMPVSEGTPLVGQQHMSLELVQDRGVGRRDRRFEGAANFFPYRVLPDVPGLSVVAEVSVATSVPRIAVELPVSGAAMQRATTPEFCTI